MTSESKTANAIGGKTARACDSCLSKRARWFCPADDAFLCQSCDVSVHSANQLASRHERVRLETSSNKSTKFVDKTHQPAWHQGFTRKARTPRNGKKPQIGQRKKREENRVPEIGCEENSPDENEFENEEQLLYQVPVFDSFEAELCNVPDETGNDMTDLDILLNTEDACDDLNLPEFLSSEIELAEFAADVESLLGSGEDEQSNTQLSSAGVEDTKAIKIEVEDEEMRAVVACHLDPELDSEREAINWNFHDYYEETVEQKAVAVTEFVTSAEYSGSSTKADEQRRLFLRLNHEAVISAWSNQSSPWTNGIRPYFNPDDCWPDFPETFGGYYGGQARSGDGGREARVSRYREKRRTRLFSKKIRYEVRKLNAEKRPRLKGRFIKRTSSTFSIPGFPHLMNKR